MPFLPTKKKMNKKSRRSIWLIAGTFFYLIFGALIFSFFEFDEEQRQKLEIHEQRQVLNRKYNFTKADYRLLEEVVVRSVPFSAGYQWKFIGAFYFCTVVITTVGYGHSTPSTTAGKMFCMVFALIGIPMGLVMFQSVGERINNIIKCFLTYIGKWLSKRGCHILRVVKPRHLLCVSFSIGIFTIAIGTWVFHKREKWTWFDAYYYCVITLSTIGFGDFVAAQSHNRLQNEVGYVIFTLFFILFGLAIFSACVNLFMAYNADIVTAKTRLRRLFSLRRTDSEVEKAKLPQRRPYRIKKNTNSIKPKISLPTPPLTNGIKCTILQHKTSDASYIAYINDVYKCYRLKPQIFAVRRQPIQYVDHLVNAESNHSEFEIKPRHTDIIV